MCKERNLRMTRQRQGILEELRKDNNHPSADELFGRVRKQMPRISLGTVYRNLEILSELGEIQTIQMAGSLKRFDGVAENHYHIRCVNCDRLIDAPVQVSKALENAVQVRTDFRILGHQVEFTGICPECRRRTPGAFPDNA
ncbi:MAG: transcriptional repressor [Desulfobacterales bacterium]|nr:transcriptional repressor [Desulfobacterales bacterium]